MGAPLTTEYSKKLGFSINSYLVSNLSYWRNMALYHDADASLVIDGKEGVGKTVLALQVGMFMDKDHHIDLETQVHFTSEGVLEAARTLPPGRAIIYDESGESLDVGLAASKKQKKMKQMFKEVRQRNLIFILVLPSFYDMQRFFAIHRTRALLHVEWKMNKTDSGDLRDNYFKRGYYRFYNETTKSILYTTDKYRKHYVYPVRDRAGPLCIFTGRFPHYYTVDEKEYRKKKAESSQSLDEAEQKKEVDWRKKTVEVFRLVQKKKLLKPGWLLTVAEILGRSKSWMNEIRVEIMNEESSDTPKLEVGSNLYSIPSKAKVEE